MQKLKEQSGETIIETLVSMLIAVICISMLATSMLAAARINEKVRRKLTAELSFRYSDPAVQQTGYVQLTFTEAAASAESKQVDITLYKIENDYYWYRSERRGASRTG